MRTILIALVATVGIPTIAAAQPPAKVGTCATSKIVAIGTRFDDKLRRPSKDVEDNGTTVALANGTYGVDYQFVEAVYESKVGDRVLVCLVSVPKDCPKGDDRGKVYTTTNLRTQRSWTLGDSQHMCGGA